MNWINVRYTIETEKKKNSFSVTEDNLIQRAAVTALLDVDQLVHAVYEAYLLWCVSPRLELRVTRPVLTV